MNMFNYRFDLVISHLDYPRSHSHRHHVHPQQEEKQIRSYQALFKEVDVRVSPVIKGGVNWADHPREALRDGPGIAMTFRVLSEHLVLLAVIPPKQSSCTQQQQRQIKPAVYHN